VRGIVERVPVCRVDAVDEEVRVVAGLGYEGEYSSRGRLDRDERPAVFAEGALGGLLQADVEGEREIVSGHRRRARRELLHVLFSAHDASARVGLDLFEAGGAVQRALVALLQTRFPDVVGAFVVARLIALLDALEVAVVDAADVTHHVRGDLSEGILAERPALDVHPWKAVA